MYDVRIIIAGCAEHLKISFEKSTNSSIIYATAELESVRRYSATTGVTFSLQSQRNDKYLLDSIQDDLLFAPIHNVTGEYE